MSICLHNFYKHASFCAIFEHYGEHCDLFVVTGNQTLLMVAGHYSVSCDNMTEWTYFRVIGKRN